MKEKTPDLNQRIAACVSGLRTTHGLSLDALATKSGVSRSMISLIERGESSPTAVVLEKLAAGLNVPLASLFETPVNSEQASSPVSRRKDQVEWQDPASGYVRRHLSPPSVPQPMQLIEIEFPAGQRVAFEAPARDVRIFQQFWVLEGTVEITVGKDCHRLRAGDCLAIQHDGLITFHNPTRKRSRYVVVVATEPTKKR